MNAENKKFHSFVSYPFVSYPDAGPDAGKNNIIVTNPVLGKTPCQVWRKRTAKIKQLKQQGVPKKEIKTIPIRRSNFAPSIA